MVTETTLSLSRYTSVSTKLSYSKTTSAQADENAKSDRSDKDQVTLSDAFDAVEKVKSAKSEDDLIALLKDGQDTIRQVMDKFRSLSRGIAETHHKKFDQGYVSDLMFGAVRDAVEGLLLEQAEKQTARGEDGTATAVSTSTSVKVSLSFEARIMTSLKERDSAFYEKLSGRLDGRDA